MKGARSGRRNAKPWIIALEPRLMFDGAAVADAAHVAADTSARALIPAVAAPVVVREADPSKDGGRKEVAFIDTSVADYKTLEASIHDGVEIVEIGGGQSGLAQMAAWADSHGGFDAIHVLSHGSEGALYLGTDALTQASLPSGVVQAELAEVGHALKVGGDLLIYGCAVGAGEAGAAFVADLATLTGADVAASADATGSFARGGNWVLETATGPVTTPSLSVVDYDGLLPTTTYDGTLTTDNTYNRPWTPFDVAYAADAGYGGPLSSADVYAGGDISQTSPTSYNYTVATFVPTATGTFSFAVTAANIVGASWDATDVFMSIYSGSFSSASPLANLYYANDDASRVSGSDNFMSAISNVSLTAGSSYIVVMTAYDSGVTGSYTFAVTGPSGGTWTEGAVAAAAGPTVSSVTSAKSNGSYKAGEVIDVTVNMSAAVNVTGTPTLTLETGTTDYVASYVAGSSTSTALVFRYTVQAGDTSADLDFASTSALSLAGGTIKAQSDNADATLTLASPGAANSLGANKAIIIDTTAPATPTVAISSDTGTNTTDGYTKTTAQTVTITAEGGATLDIDYGDGTAHGSASGAHTYAAGKYTISATATDAAGNISTAGTKVIVVDTAAPTDVTPSTASRVTAAATNGAVFCTLSAVDATSISGYTDAWSYAITGGADQGKFTIANGNELTINNSGGLSAGSYTVQVTATDKVGNSYAKTLNLSVVSGPTFSSGATASFAENGSGSAYAPTLSASSGTVSYALSGGADQGLFNIDASTGAVTFKNAPNFEAAADSGANNVYDIVVSATDDNGTSTQSVAVTVTNVNEAPTNDAVTISAAEDTTYTIAAATFSGAFHDVDAGAAFAGIKVTSAGATAGTLYYNGSAISSAGQVVSLADLNANKLTYRAAADSNGNGYATFSYQTFDGTAYSGSDATATINVSAVNDAPTRTAGTPSAITVNEDSANTTAVTLGLSGLTYGNGGGADEAGQTLTYTVTAIPSVITVYKSDGTTQVTAGNTVTLTELKGLTYKTVGDAAGTGNLTWTVVDDGGGTNTLYDAAGNVTQTTFSVNQTTTGNQSAPQLAALPDGGFLVVWTNENGTDGIDARRYDASGNAVTDEFRVNATTTGNKGGPMVAATNGGVMVAWDVGNDVWQRVYAPTIPYTENDPATAIGSGLILTDVDSANASGATVVIAANLTSGDVLDFTPVGNITGSYNAATGTLTLSGADSLANYTTALRSVTYRSTSDTPTASSASRKVDFTLTDSGGASGTASRYLAITAVNDAPVITNLGGDANSFSVGGGAITLDAGTALTITDVDSTTLASATVSITTNFQTAEDVLAFSNDGSTMGNISASYTAGTGVLSMTSAGATATLAQWTAALKAVTYNDTDATTGNTAQRTIRFAVNDGTDSSANADTTVSLVRAPILDLDTTNGATQNTTASFTEDAGAIALVGANIGISDDATTFKALKVVVSDSQDGANETLTTSAGTGAQTIGGEAVTITYTAGTHTLDITVDDGSANAASLQAIMQAIRFNDASHMSGKVLLSPP